MSSYFCAGPKGRRDRDLPMTPKLLEALREYWRSARPKVYLFPSPNKWDGRERPICSKTVWHACHNAAVRAGLTKRIGLHTLRHYLPFLTMSCPTTPASYRWTMREMLTT